MKMQAAMAALFFWSCFLPGAALGESPAVPLSQEIAVTLVPVEHLLLGDSTLNYAASVEMLALDLNPAARIDRVSSGAESLPHSFQNGRLIITPPPTSGPWSIAIRYRLTLNDPLPAATAGSEDPSYGINGIISPLGVFLGSDSGWYPRPPAAPLRRIIHISAPAGMEGVTVGERLSRETFAGTTRSVWQEEPPLGELSLAAGHYVIKERKLGGLLISTYFYPENAGLADSYLEAAGSYLQLFSELFGPYPFKKFAVVENFFPTGYGLPSFTLLGSTVIRLPFIRTTSLPHEIAHSWWGNGVLVDSRQGNWSEGLVTYLADHLLEERKGGTAGRDYRLRLLTDFSLLVPAELDIPLTGFTSRIDPATRAIGYGKGAMLWHMLRRRVGDEAFFAALKEVFHRRRFQSAAWDDFSRALARSSGQELDSFISPWLERPGGAHLSLAEVRSQPQDGKWLVTGVVEQTKPFFPLLLPLRLETSSAGFDQTLLLKGEQTPFHYLTDTPPRRLLLDPDVDVFRLLSADQLPANVNRLKGSRRLLAVVTPGCGSAEASLRLLLESLGQGRVKLIAEKELARGDDHDLIFCGLPRGATDRFDLPPGLELTKDSFSINGESYGRAEDLLFLVTRQRTAPGRVSALFLPLSPGAAASAVAKITHYGNYATLVFTGGSNRYKSSTPRQPAGGQVIFFEKELP